MNDVDRPLLKLVLRCGHLLFKECDCLIGPALACIAFGLPGRDMIGIAAL